MDFTCTFCCGFYAMHCKVWRSAERIETLISAPHIHLRADIFSCILLWFFHLQIQMKNPQQFVNVALRCSALDDHFFPFFCEFSRCHNLILNAASCHVAGLDLCLPHTGRFCVLECGILMLRWNSVGTRCKRSKIVRYGFAFKYCERQKNLCVLGRDALFLEKKQQRTYPRWLLFVLK